METIGDRIDFVGKQYETHILLADVQLTRAPGETLTGIPNEKGVALLIPFGDVTAPLSFQGDRSAAAAGGPLVLLQRLVPRGQRRRLLLVLQQD